MLPAYEHQKLTTEFILDTRRCFDMSDPGTGKTRSSIDAVKQFKKKTLVLAPLSILQPSWAMDAQAYAPDQSIAIAYAKNRAAAFKSGADMVICNHDAIKWIAKQLDKDAHFLDEYDTCVNDEFTAYKNRTSQRSKAAAKVLSCFKNVIQLSGTPNSNGVLNLWHPAYLADGGDRLGKNFFQFRASVCAPYQVGPRPEMREWREKPEAVSLVASLLSDITIRHCLEDCLDMPEKVTNFMYVKLPKAIQDQYNELKDESILFTADGVVNAVHAGARVKKLLQLVTGAVYDGFGDVHSIHSERYELVMSLIESREHCLVAFNWKHERDKLIELAKKAKITFAVIDGDVSVTRREHIVREFQAGEIKVLFAHPQSAGHGLTLTRATTTIWCSPTYNAEHFQQFNRRIYRAGQTKRTETILIAAEDTWETEVYERLDGKLDRMDNLLDIFTQITSYVTKGKTNERSNSANA